MIAPRLWCRTCRHYLGAHKLRDGRAHCGGCGSFHEYRGANAFLLWLCNAKVEWGGLGLGLVPLVILMIVGRWV